ncbi:MAG: serine/threonine protein kinase, partial [uncultured Thermomicrobiales bacterium]
DPCSDCGRGAGRVGFGRGCFRAVGRRGRSRAALADPCVVGPERAGRPRGALLVGRPPRRRRPLGDLLPGGRRRRLGVRPEPRGLPVARRRRVVPVRPAVVGPPGAGGCRRRGRRARGHPHRQRTRDRARRGDGRADRPAHPGAALADRGPDRRVRRVPAALLLRHRRRGGRRRLLRRRPLQAVDGGADPARGHLHRGARGRRLPDGAVGPGRRRGLRAERRQRRRQLHPRRRAADRGPERGGRARDRPRARHRPRDDLGRPPRRGLAEDGRRRAGRPGAGCRVRVGGGPRGPGGRGATAPL